MKLPRKHRHPGKERLAGAYEPETLLRVGGRLGGLRRATCFGRGAGGTNGAYKPARVRVWLGPGHDLCRCLDRVPPQKL